MKNLLSTFIFKSAGVGLYNGACLYGGDVTNREFCQMFRSMEIIGHYLPLSECFILLDYIHIFIYFSP